MARSKENISAGAGVLYIGDSTSALPEIDDNTTGSLTFGSGWSDIGFTEGVTVEYEVEMQEIKVDGHLAPIKLIPTSESAIVTAKIHQRDVSNFNYAISCSSLTVVDSTSDQAGQDILKVGDGTLVEKQVAFVGKSPEGYYRLWHFPIAVSTGAFKYEGTNESTPVDIEFTALCDTTATIGERLFVIYDMTDVAA